MAACSSDPQFPDPGYDMSSDRAVTIRRDTADTYTLSLNVKAPAGIATIQLLNGRNYKVIEEYPEYAGKTYFTLEHTFDFAALDKTVDTTLIYNLRIVTNDSRGYNKSIRMDLIRLSVPEFSTALKEKITIFAPLAVVEGTVTTGVYGIKSVKFYLDNEFLYEVPQTELVDENGAALKSYDLNARLSYAFDKNKEYSLKMVIEDDHNQSQAYYFTLVRTPLSRVRKIYYSNGLWTCYIKPYYNDKGQLVFIDWSDEMLDGYFANRYNTTYEYDDNGYLVCIMVTKKIGSMSRRAWSITRDEAGRIASVYAWSASYSDGYTKHSKIEELYDFKYNADGTIKSYFAESTTIENPPYQDGFEPGEKVWALLYDTEAGSGKEMAAMTKNYWWKTCDLVPVLNPLYIEGSELVYDLLYADSYVHQPVHFKYVFNTLYANGTNNYANRECTLNYTLREDGQLRTWQTSYRGGFMRYIYEDDPADTD